MCSPRIRKEANRYYWMIKGKLIDSSWSDSEVEKIYDSYFKRLWGNNENYIHEAGFEAAYKARADTIINEDEDIDKVAVRGYD
jgi:hypothetical protein